jgi:hypothetical protein
MLRKVRALAQALLFGGVTLALLATEPLDDPAYDGLGERPEEVSIQGESLLSAEAPSVTLRIRAVLHDPVSELKISFNGRVARADSAVATDADAGVLADFVDASLVNEGLREPLRQTFLTSFGLSGWAYPPRSCESAPSCEVVMEAKLARHEAGPGAVRIAWTVAVSGTAVTSLADGGAGATAPWTLELVTNEVVDADAGTPIPEAE